MNKYRNPPRPAGGAVNTQPVLPETLVELAPAYQVAPPVAVESWIDRKLHETTPVVLLTVAALPPDDEFIVINLPEVPLTLKLLVIVVVVAEVSVRVRALVTSEKFMVPKVLEPSMISLPVEPATV